MKEEMLEIIPESATTQQAQEESQQQLPRLDGVVIGVLLSITDAGKPLVVFPGNQNQTGIEANSTTPLKDSDIGRDVALLFEGGNPERPLVIGRIQHPEEMLAVNKQEVTVEKDGERLQLHAKEEIELKCGKASITLTKAGKVIIRGKYVLSRSSGANRIKGGSVQIN